MSTTLNTYCETIHLLMKSNKTTRGTITGEYFREIVNRQRVEASFLKRLNKHAMKNFRLGIVKLDRSRFLVFRTHDKYLKGDPYLPENEGVVT